MTEPVLSARRCDRERPPMRLLSTMYPVEHLDASVEYYRALGLTPVWWPDDASAILASGVGDPAVVMLTHDPIESPLGPGAVIAVADVDEFLRQHPTLDWLIKPSSRPIGRYAAFADRTGQTVRLLDYSEEPEAAAVFGVADLAPVSTPTF